MSHRYKILVTGRVQRVSFRAHTVKKALSLGLTGSATNLANGTVEVLAQGGQESLDALVKWLHKGPMLARVDSVTWEQVKPVEAEEDFSRC